MRTRGWVALVLLAVLALANTGCALHSEARDKQGQELKEAWGKVDLGAQVTAPRKNLAALLDEQLKLEDDLWQFYRTSVANDAVLRWTVGMFRKSVDDRIIEIADSEGELNKANKAAQDAVTARAKLVRPQQDVRLAGLSWPGCEATQPGPKQDEFFASLAPLPPEKALVARTAVENAAKDCKDLAAANAVGIAGGELGRARKALADEEAAEQAAESELADAVKAVKSASTEFDTESAKLAASPTSRTDKVDAAKKRLQDALAKLSSLQSAVGQEFVSSTRLQGLNEFLSTYDNIRAGKGAPEGSSRAAIALALFPDIKDKADQALLDAKKPRLLPLLMLKKVEQARLDGAQRNVARRKQVIALRQAQVDLLMQQVSTATAVKRSLDVLVNSSKVKDSEALGPWLVPLKTSPLDISGDDKNAERAKAQDALQTKQELWRALALHLHSQGRLRADVSKLRFQVTALGYEEPISYAESGLMQWKALLDPSVELLADYGASGLKAKDIQDFLNTLSLLWIAAEVKR